jgi:hypothetical protein
MKLNALALINSKTPDDSRGTSFSPFRESFFSKLDKNLHQEGVGITLYSKMSLIAVACLWLLAGIALAWLFGGACRLGGPQDPRAPSSDHGAPSVGSQTRPKGEQKSLQVKNFG